MKFGIIFSANNLAPSVRGKSKNLSMKCSMPKSTYLEILSVTASTSPTMKSSGFPILLNGLLDRILLASPRDLDIATIFARVFFISSGLLFTLSQCLSRISSFRRNVSMETFGRFHQSAYLATILNISFSPPPPIIIGGTGSGLGKHIASSTL